MVKITVGIILFALFAYAFKLVLGIRRIARKEKELAMVTFDEEVVDIDKEIEVKKKRIARKKKDVKAINGEETSTAEHNSTAEVPETADTQT